MSDMSKWEHRDEWHRRGKDFHVVVMRRAVDQPPYSTYKIRHYWSVYAYIYSNHRLFGDFNGTSMSQPAAKALPLHGGPALLTWNYNENHNPTSVQIGAYYLDLYDMSFCNYATADEARKIFSDADKLFDHLLDKLTPEF